jgi:hypothetical protein
MDLDYKYLLIYAVGLALGYYAWSHFKTTGKPY